MYKKGKKTCLTLLALLLAVLVLLPVEAAALEDPASQPPASEPVSTEEPTSTEEPAPTEEPTSTEEPVSTEEPASTEEPTSTQEPASSEETGQALAESEAAVYASYPLLVVGGHKAYMSGMDGAVFQPDKPLTRAETATVLYKLLASQDPVQGSHFTDVDSSAWYGPAVNTLVEKGILSGDGDNTYRPDDSITRAEFLTALCKCFQLGSAANTFPDVEGHWAQQAISSAVAAGWAGGFEDGTFRPNNPITRAEAAAILNQALERTGSGFAADAETTQEFIDVPTTHWAFRHVAEAADPSGHATLRVTTALNMRTGPGTSYEKITLLSQGTLLVALSLGVDGWAHVETPSGQTGYVSSQYTEHYTGSKPDGGPDDDDPPDNEDPEPSDGFSVGQTVRVTATSGLRLREGPGTDYPQVALLNTGVLLTVTSVESNGWLGVSTGAGEKGYVSGEYVEVYTGSTGSATGAALSASKGSLAQYQSFRLDGSVTSNLEAMGWESSNPSVAYVAYTVDYGGNRQGAMVYGASPGTATITFRDADGTTSASCVITVNGPQSVRFAYADENIVAAGAGFHLVAVTDQAREAVRFTIQSGPASGTYETDEYEDASQVSSYGLPTNRSRTFYCPVEFGEPGLYTVRAQSRTAGGSWSNSYYSFTVLVTSSNVSATTATYDTRRTSSEMIWILANYEGFVPEIEDDQLAAGNPTVGYGYVVPQNTAFYNNLTQSEAFAQLVDMVNGDGYADSVESFRANNGRSGQGIKMSQAQFDALVSFAYNLGPGSISSQYSTFRAMLNAVDPTGVSYPTTGTLNVSDATLYSAPSTSSERLGTVVLTLDDNGNYATKVTVTGYQDHRNSRQQEVWYSVTTAEGQTGWVPAGYVELAGSLPCDLSWVDSTVVANNLLQWCHAGGVTVPGLVYRRLSESKIFFFGDYAEGNPSSSNYRVNTYGFLYPSDAADYEH